MAINQIASLAIEENAPKMEVVAPPDIPWQGSLVFFIWAVINVIIPVIVKIICRRMKRAPVDEQQRNRYVQINKSTKAITTAQAAKDSSVKSLPVEAKSL